MSVAAFSYAQARLQARHAQRPGPTDWRMLEGVGDAVHFLQVARGTRLRRWVLALQGDQDSHRIELLLRRQFQAYIDEVLSWMPPPWNRQGAWLKRLPELPAIQHLLGGAEPPAWMHADERLSDCFRADQRHQLQAIRQSGCAPLVEAWQRGENLVDAWFDQWQAQWHDERRARDGLARLSAVVREVLQPPPQAERSATLDARREDLAARLTTLFRRHALQPTACYAHLALTALDLVTLRGELMKRVLFNGDRAVAS